MTLGGFTMIRNGNLLDFCWKECVNSLLPVCDVVAVSVAPGDDDTEREVRDWVGREPKLSINIYPWPEPKGDPEWFVSWIQYARMHTPADWVFQLDADEVLSEKSYDEVREFIKTPGRTGVVTRHNFWLDHRHTIQDGICLGKRVIRLAEAGLWLASDGWHPKGEAAAALGVNTDIEIFHYGFIRKREQFFQKERLLQGYFFNQYDQRLEAVEKKEGNWMADPSVGDYCGHLDDFSGDHPLVAVPWLKERGYQ